MKAYFGLHNGVSIPRIGYGTWQTPDGEIAEKSVKTAIEMGYRHIDAAACYNFGKQCACVHNCAFLLVGKFPTP